MGVLTLIHIYKAPAHNRSCATQEDVMRMLQLQRRFACLDLCLSLLCAKSCYSHGSHTRVHCTPYTVHRTYEYSCDCAVKECHFYVINICSRSALTSYLPTLLHPPPPLHIYSSQPPRTTRNKCNEDTIHSREPNLLNMILFW